ncbi:MAG: site-specific integrase [Lachnospiraceae bacterium]|nr:site-specific integrase [Lachnospiraceae bacterium]
MSNIKRKDDRGRQLKGGESQRSDGRYQYQYFGLDKKRHSVYSWRLLPSDKIPAGRKMDVSLREKELEIQKTLLEGEKEIQGNITLDEMFDIYIKKKKYKGKPLTQNTIKNYTSMYNKHIRGAELGQMNLQKIRKANIVAFYHQLQEIGLSYGTILFYRKILSAIFNMAIDDEFIDKNPTVRALDEIEGSQMRKEALTVNEQESLLEFAKRSDGDMYHKLVFLIDTMCRVSEFAGITWNDIDMKERIISINHQLQYEKYINDKQCGYHILSTKGKEIRYVPMTQRLYDILNEMKKYYFITRKETVVDGVTDFIFHSSKGHLVHADVFRHELSKLLKAYNENSIHKIGYLTPHMLRHTGCTRNAENGMDLKVLQYLMGHKSSKVTNDVYNHVTRERSTKEMLKTAKNQLKQA